MRTCVIDIPGLTGRLLDSLPAARTPGWFNEMAAAGRATIEPVLPAVTMTAQATMTTGASPAEHGMIANGLAAFRNPELKENLDLSNFASFRCNVSFWEQSNKLLGRPRVWSGSDLKVALICVQSSMGGAAEVVVTPKPEHTPDGKTVSLCWTSPGDLYGRLKEALGGDFPLMHYWGPMAGMKSSEWITMAGRLVWEWENPDLMWCYVPQMDYDLQRLGPEDPRCIESLLQVLGLLTPLVERVKADGGRALLLSEYGMTAVNRSCAPNVHLRKAHLLAVDGAGEVDYARSEAFAMCDHQVAHVYCVDKEALREAEKILFNLPEVEKVYRGPQRAEIGLDCERAGDLVVMAKEDAWFEYRWFEDFEKAPAYAWKVDIHSKPGYDPTEMFFDMANRRIRANEPGLVKGSHGIRPRDKADWPVLLGAAAGRTIMAADVAGLLL